MDEKKVKGTGPRREWGKWRAAQKSQAAMTYTCSSCHWHGNDSEAIEEEHAELVDDMHDRGPRHETFTDLYCPQCGEELEDPE